MANSSDTVYVLVIEGRDFKDIVEVALDLEVAQEWEARNATPTGADGFYGYYPVKITCGEDRCG